MTHPASTARIPAQIGAPEFHHDRTQVAFEWHAPLLVGRHRYLHGRRVARGQPGIRTQLRPLLRSIDVHETLERVVAGIEGDDDHAWSQCTGDLADVQILRCRPATDSHRIHARCQPLAAQSGFKLVRPVERHRCIDAIGLAVADDHEVGDAQGGVIAKAEQIVRALRHQVGIRRRTADAGDRILDG